MLRQIEQMLTYYWFWGVLALAVLAWYSSVTIYVAVRGLLDIKQMFGRLGRRQAQQQQTTN